MKNILHSFIRTYRICAVVLIVMLNFQNWHVWCDTTEINPVCNTTECKQLGDRYLNSMNKNGNPCVDFYDYACHGWPIQFPKPNYSYRWSTTDELQERANAKIRDLLQTPNLKSNETRYSQARALYNACLNLPHMDKITFAEVEKVMANVEQYFLSLNSSSSVDWWEMDTKYIKQTGESALFDFVLIADGKNNNTIIPQLKRLYSPYGMLKRFTDWGVFSDEKDHYRKFLTKLIATIMQQNFTNVIDTLDLQMRQIIKFREVLREISDSAANEKFKLMTIKEFQNWYDAKTKSHVAIRIDWLKTVRAIYKNSTDPYGNLIDDTSMVSVQKNYFSLLAKALKNAVPDEIINHVHLYFAERHAILTPEMENDLKQSFVDQVEQTGLIRCEMPRWRYCIVHHNMGLTIRKMYVESVFPQAKKLHLEKLFKETQDIMAQQVNASTWMDPRTKKESIEKIMFTTSTIGYPDWLLKFVINVEFNIFDLDPLIGNAYYSSNTNHICKYHGSPLLSSFCDLLSLEITVTATLLQEPIYSENTPYVILYGATMPVLAHELYHALDSNGILFDKYGEIPGWTESMYYQYENKSLCFENQFDDYKQTQIQSLHLDPTVETVSTVNEDIPDVMGLKLSYRAFKRMLQRSNGTCPILPGFEHMNCEQLFFIAFANTACAASLKNVDSQQLLYDEHSLNPVRINGAVADTKAFSAAFGCKPDDPLNLKHKCDIWRN